MSTITRSAVHIPGSSSEMGIGVAEVHRDRPKLEAMDILDMTNRQMVVKLDSLDEARERLDDLCAVYREYGALILPGLFRHDDTFLSYEEDLFTLMTQLMGERNLSWTPEDELDELVTRLASVDRGLVGALYDIGTRPIKLVSGTRLKSHPFVIEILQKIFGSGPIAYPYLGETLHVFPPGEENERYNLPMHQDYPYLMQSSDQVTAYFNFGHQRSPSVGGVRFWMGSHVDGISQVRKSEFGHWESVVDDAFHRSITSSITATLRSLTACFSTAALRTSRRIRDWSS